MKTLDAVLKDLGPRFGVLAESSTTQLKVIAQNTDVAIGDLFLLPCQRGPDRFYVFRATEYANVMNRSLEMADIARNKLTMPDSYFSSDLVDEKQVELTGMVLGYAEWEKAQAQWSFHRPRRLPQHLTDVYQVRPSEAASGAALAELLQSQLGGGGLRVGRLLAGEAPVVPASVHLPARALSHHLGVFGRTGCGKSNLMMVLLRSAFTHNRDVRDGTVEDVPVSLLAIDPHDEFRSWHAPLGGADGYRGMVAALEDDERADLVAPFYYLSARDAGLQGPLEQRVFLSRGDITPLDLSSIMEFSEQQMAFANQLFAEHGEAWIARLLSGDLELPEGGAEYLPGTVAAVQRRLGFLAHGTTRIVTRFDPDPTVGLPYESGLADLVCALERGRCVIVDTTLMSELEQFLFTTVVARTLFSLRRALKAADTADRLQMEIRSALGGSDRAPGLRTLANDLVRRTESGDLPYLAGGSPRSPGDLPYLNVVVEEAPSILNPQRMRFGSVFRDISRQGRKFGIGLTVVSQQVTEIDAGILSQLNTQFTFALGNADERREAVRNAAADIGGFAQELQVLSPGQALLTTSFKDVPLPIQVPEYKG